MEDFIGRQYYPRRDMNFMVRVQTLINAYYESDSGINQIGTTTPVDDVDRLGNQLSTFPRCINEHVDKLLVDELSIGLPEEDVEYLKNTHNMKCKQSIAEARKAIEAIERYSAALNIPHLFTKEETDDLSDECVLDLVVKVVIDMYGEEQVATYDYLNNLKETRQKLDNTLLSLDYDD